MTIKQTVVRRTVDRRPVISGADIFKLKDTEGFPLAMTLIECERNGAEIGWVGFVREARDHGWWDYQVLEAITEAFADSGVWADRRTEVERKIKIYMLANPHPKMTGVMN